MEELYYKYNFPSLEKFKQILKINKVNVSNKDVVNFIEKQNVKQLHKPTQNIKEKSKFIFALEPYEMMQIDLLDYQKYATKNKGYKFILIAVDIFTRMAFGIPIKDKKPDSVLQGFLKFDVKPFSIYHDSGTEYKGNFLKYLNENHIINYNAEVGDHHSLGIIDRFSKTLKTMISKYMTAYDTTVYYDEVEPLIKVYNHTPHSSLGNISPIDVTKDKENMSLVNQINYAKMKFNNTLNKHQLNKFKVGETVRVKLKKHQFKKGYEVTFSKEVFKIISIDGDIATLNDDSKHKFKNLLVVIEGSENISNSNKDAQEEEINRKRKLKKDGFY